jgi:hypothetical protein
MKTCSKCGKEKDYSEYHVDRRNKDGYCITCKKCRKEHYMENRDSIAAYKKKYREEHIYNIMTTRQEHYERNKDAIKAKALKYYYENKSKRENAHRKGLH